MGVITFVYLTKKTMQEIIHTPQVIAFLCAWFITHFAPIQDGIESVFKRFDGVIIENIYDALTCFKCTTFILVTASTLNPFYGIAFAIVADLISIYESRGN